MEDAPAGVTAGRAAGMQVVGLLTTHGRDALAHAHHVVDDLAALTAMLPVRSGSTCRRYATESGAGSTRRGRRSTIAAWGVGARYCGELWR